MAEYIEREAIAKLFDSECCGECVVCPHDDYGDCTLINQIPTTDVQTVKHGQWETEICDDGYGAYNLFVCSLCGSESAKRFNYCRECGARMDGEDNV